MTNSYEWSTTLSGYASGRRRGKERFPAGHELTLKQKPKGIMKRTQTLKSYGLALAALLTAGSSLVVAQTPTTNLNSFAGNPGTAPVGCGVGYGAGTILVENSQLYPGTTGSGYVALGYSATDPSGTPLQVYICFPGGPDQEYYYQAGWPTVDLSQYSAVQFEILWDTNDSNIPIDEVNNPQNYGWGANSIKGLSIEWCAEANNSTEGDVGALATIQIPDAASNGWQTITVPIPGNLSHTAGTTGIVLHHWVPNDNSFTAYLNGTNFYPQAYFWISDVNLIGTAAPPPPPTLQVQTKPTPGLNVWASTDGNTYYDRQEVGLVASNGVSWVGKDLTSPVTYSFTINGFPQNPSSEGTTSSGGCEAYIMLAANPLYYDNAIDYNEANGVIVNVQQVTNGTSVMTFQYKTNAPYSENFTTIGTLTKSGNALGTWSVTFSSDTNVTLTAPDGTTSSFLFTNASYFAETANPGMYLYLGMQANAAGALNQAVCYSQFSITGVPAAMSDNFLADSTLNTNLWFNFMGHAPVGSFVMPPSAENWVSYTLPAAGFQFQYATTLSGPWTALNDTNDVTMPAVGEVLQLITTNDIPAGTHAAFFDMANP